MGGYEKDSNIVVGGYKISIGYIKLAIDINSDDTDVYNYLGVAYF